MFLTPKDKIRMYAEAIDAVSAFLARVLRGGKKLKNKNGGV